MITMATPKFRKTIIAEVPHPQGPDEMNTLLIVGDVYTRGALDLIGKPLHAAELWNVHVYLSDTR